jgi:transcriptional regulator with XRE-family HTH domain
VEKILNVVGQRIREKRKERGLSQEELGEKAGFHFSYIGGVERAEKNITIVNLQKIANALEIEIYELFKDHDAKPRTLAEKDQMLSKINQFLWSMQKSELKKVLVFLSQIMGRSK